MDVLGGHRMGLAGCIKLHCRRLSYGGKRTRSISRAKIRLDGLALQEAALYFTT